MAEGATGSNDSGDSASVPPIERTIYGYDNLGDIVSINYPDSSADVTYSRDDQGNLKTLTAGAVSHSYNYNSQHALELETLNVDGKSLTLDYEYNSLGALESLKYPNNHVVSYAPNAFGQPTQANRAGQNYAAGALYHPNGILKSFTYGNELIHNTSINNRQLPKDISDVLGAEVAINQSYTYDYQGNITSLIDNARSGFSLNSLTYDALDRLKTTTDDTDTLRASLSYDSLGNITYYKTINTTLKLISHPL